MTSDRTLPPVLRYSGFAITLHWLLAAALIVSFGMGLYMTGLPLSPQRIRLYNWHKWAGVVILTLSFVRLVWRLFNAPPPDLPAPAWQRLAAHVTHQAMYVLFFAVPLVGWAYSSAVGFPIVVFGVLPLPDFVPVDKALAAQLKSLHVALAYLLAALAVMHVAAALKHHFIDRDGLISRMRPGRG
jgi:cytochrome b561